MSHLWLDLIVNTAVDSSLVAAQALVLDRLGIPFAAITAFAGLGAYMLALGLIGAWSWSAGLLLLLMLSVACFALLARPLPQDQYLLLTLAALGILRSLAGTTSRLGGQIGITSASTVLRPQEPATFIIPASIVFACSLLAHLIVDRSEFGVAVRLARLSRVDTTLTALVPVRRLTITCLLFAATVAGSAGILRALYSGRVDPDVFRIQSAITFLMATLVAGSGAVRVGLLSIAFFAFPGLFALVFGYDASILAYIREMLWSVLAIALLARRFTGTGQWLRGRAAEMPGVPVGGRN
jgi:ABC-type branched-subunit amino acid transport system permease subunit